MLESVDWENILLHYVVRNGSSTAAELVGRVLATLVDGVAANQPKAGAIRKAILHAALSLIPRLEEEAASRGAILTLLRTVYTLWDAAPSAALTALLEQHIEISTKLQATPNLYHSMLRCLLNCRVRPLDMGFDRLIESISSITSHSSVGPTYPFKIFHNDPAMTLLQPPGLHKPNDPGATDYTKRAVFTEEQAAMSDNKNAQILSYADVVAKKHNDSTLIFNFNRGTLLSGTSEIVVDLGAECEVLGIDLQAEEVSMPSCCHAAVVPC